MHKSGEGKKLIRILVGQGVFFAKERLIVEENKKPTSFCMLLRKKLKQARIADVVQPGLERVMEIQCSNGMKIIIELLSKGNVILADKNDLIVAVLEEQEWKDRKIKRGLKYMLPPTKANPFTIDEKEFTEIINKSEKENIVKTLAIDFCLGGKYAEEVCFVTRIDKTKKRVDTSKLWKAVYSLQYREMKPYLTIGAEGGEEYSEFSPVELHIHGKSEKKYFNTSSEALEEYFKEGNEDVMGLKEEKQRLQELAETQKQQIEDLAKRSEEYKKIGDLIYRYFSDIEVIMKDFRLKKGDVVHPLVKEVNKQERKVILELE